MITFLSAKKDTEVFDAVCQQSAFDNVVRIAEESGDFLLNKLMQG